MVGAKPEGFASRNQHARRNGRIRFSLRRRADLLPGAGILSATGCCVLDWATNTCLPWRWFAENKKLFQRLLGGAKYRRIEGLIAIAIAWPFSELSGCWRGALSRERNDRCCRPTIKRRARAGWRGLSGGAGRDGDRSSCVPEGAYPLVGGASPGAVGLDCRGMGVAALASARFQR